MKKILRKKVAEADLRVDQAAEVDPDLIVALVQEVMEAIRTAKVQSRAEAAAVQAAAQRRRRKRARKESSMLLTQTKRKRSLLISSRSRAH